MALTQIKALLLVSGARASVLRAPPATGCPSCYTRTVTIDQPTPACPPFNIYPPDCACVIYAELEPTEGSEAEQRRGDSPYYTTVRIDLTVTETATATDTVPGVNPACATTPTVTVTRGPATQTVDLVCPARQRPSCNCRQRTQYVPVHHTVTRTVTSFATGAPLTCSGMVSEATWASLEPRHRD